MQYSTLLATLLAAVPALAIPPEDFGFPSAPNDTALGVTFNAGQPNQVIISEGELLGPVVAAQAPQVSVDAATYDSIASYNGAYVLMMVDPDAPTPQDPSRRFILHWMAANLTMTAPHGILTNSTPAVVPYGAPMPPPNSDAHRYILYAFQQPENFMVPADFSGLSNMNRTGFNATQFIAEAGLMTPAAAQYFYVKATPPTSLSFTAPAGSSYPDGNGGMITAGPGPVVTPTGTMDMSMTGDMGSMSSGMSGMSGSMTSAMSGSMTSGASGAASTTAAAARVDAVGIGAAVVAAAGGLAAFAL